MRPIGVIVGGHATVEALKRMGRTEVECRVVAGLAESGYKALGLALNRLPENSSWDEDILRGVLSELGDNGEDAIGLGFSSTELAPAISASSSSGMDRRALVRSSTAYQEKTAYNKVRADHSKASRQAVNGKAF